MEGRRPHQRPAQDSELTSRGKALRAPEARRAFPTDREASPSLYSTTMRSLAPRPKVSGAYISSALAGGTTKVPGVVARAT